MIVIIISSYTFYINSILSFKTEPHGSSEILAQKFCKNMIQIHV